MEQLQRLVQAVDEFQQRRRWLAFPVAVVKKYGEDQGGQRAALPFLHQHTTILEADRQTPRELAVQIAAQLG